MWSATGADASRIGAEGRWREGIFLGLWCWSRCDRLRGGNGDGVEEARVIKFGTDESAWDVELVLSVKETPAVGPQASRPDEQGQHDDSPVAGRSSAANRASSRRRWMSRRSSWPTTGVHQKERRNLEVRSKSWMSRLPQRTSIGESE